MTPLGFGDNSGIIEEEKKSKHYTKIFWMEKKLNEHYALKNNDGFSFTTTTRTLSCQFIKSCVPFQLSEK